MIRQFCIFVLSCIGLTGCDRASPWSKMQPGEQGRVVRVIDGDALILNTGQSVRLVNIEAPALRPRDREPESYAVEASRMLEDMVLGREVQLFYPGLTRDRYDRALAHVVTIDDAGPEIWLNLELVKKGAARVRAYPDTAAQVELFLSVETEARLAETGLWGNPAYRIQSAGEVSANTRGFLIVEAKLSERSAQPADTETQLACRWSVLEGSLQIDVALTARAVCAWPSRQAVRLRGWISGNRIDLNVAGHAQKLDDAAPSRLDQ